ncbi:MAG: hypothetical protein ACRDRB_22905 [Pseudonocardiaceae bacterium]
MFLGPIFERFVAGSPLSVMARATIEHALNADALDALFERSADRQYTQDLLFSTLVDLMSLTVCGVQPHIQAAFQDQAARVPVTRKSVYEKLKRVEPTTCAALVRFAAERCATLVRALGGGRAPRLPGWRIKIRDGNHLAATEQRLTETRRRAAAPLPGLSLVLLDPELGIATDVVPCEDGHAQERSLRAAVLERIEPGDALVADRNFCTADFLAAVAAKPAAVVIRHHATRDLEFQGDWRPEVVTATGRVSERPSRVVRAGVAILALRAAAVGAAGPGRRPGGAGADEPAGVGERGRGGRVVPGPLECGDDVPGAHAALGLCGEYPVLPAGGVVRVQCGGGGVQRAGGGEGGPARGPRSDQGRGGGLGLLLGVGVGAGVGGLMIALPAAGWQIFRGCDAAAMAMQLRAWALRMDLRKYQKHPRAPKKPQPARTYDKKGPHISTAQLLKQRKRTIT